MLKKVTDFLGKNSNVRRTEGLTKFEKIGLKGLTEQHFDELKKESAENLDFIEIDCSCAVKIAESNFSDVEAHFWGNAYLKGTVNFNVMKIGNTLKIKVELNGDFHNVNFKLEVLIPSAQKFKKLVVNNTFDSIKLFGESILVDKLKISNSSGDSFIIGKFDDVEITSTFGRIDLNSKGVNNLKIENDSGDTYLEGSLKKIKAKSSFGKIILNTNSGEKLQLQTSSGDISIRGDFKVIDIKSDMGNVKSEIYAKSEVKIDIKTSSGNASFKFENIKKVNAVGSIGLGKFSNKVLENPCGYIANIRYKTDFGKITIK
ncbi:MAG: DUF4097 family beta strand repeat protein [Clostridia bacterium]|nr:DUF4097 family beta strand repeat protein [Clostridia bacterium]